MCEVRPVRSEEFDEYARMTLDAYPAMFPAMSEEQRQGWVERMRKINQEDEDAPVKYYGCYRSGAMVGGMRLHDFYMTVYESRVFTGGVGNVFVDLARKKEHVSKDMMEWFHRHYLERGAALAALYPFRPDFYRRMGYGYGRKNNIMLGRTVAPIGQGLVTLAGGFNSYFAVRVFNAAGIAIGGSGMEAGGPSWNALIADLVPSEKRATVLGTIGTLTAVVAAPGSVLGGYLWDTVSPQLPFQLSMVIGLVSAALFWLKVREPRDEEKLGVEPAGG